MIDFIIVGRGLAANVIAHTLNEKNLSFTIIGDENLSSCSKVAAGIWNPIVFKRFTKSWLANELVPYLNQFYTNCGRKMGKNFITQRDLIKPFSEEQEKKLWLNKASTELIDFLDDTIYKHYTAELKNCNILNEYGRVKQCGNLDIVEFLKATALFFKPQLRNEIFDYTELKIEADCVFYKDLVAKNIIFCEGYLVKNNPFFKWIPLKPVKGELLIIAAPDLKLSNQIFNKNGFLMDTKDNKFIIGATYEWDDLAEKTTEKGLVELQAKLNHLITCNYTIIEQKTGIRPSSLDRRPIVGKHPRYTNLFVFNGLGTKGVMLAPYFAKKFVNFYQLKEELPKEVNVDRFYSYYAP